MTTVNSISGGKTSASIAIILLLCGIGLLIWIVIEITGFKL